MKKISYIIALMMVAGMSSCSKDPLEGSGNYTNSVTVVSQDVCFDAPASEGTIQFKAPGAATVSASSKWCTAALSGDVIKVSATQNNTRNSRSCNVVIRCGTDSAVVNVIQKGFIFQLSAGNVVMASSDETRQQTYAFAENLDFRFQPSAEWFTAGIDGDSLRISFAENTTGHIRKGQLYYIAGGAKDSLTVIQYDFDKDIAGPALMYYRDANGDGHYTNIVLESDGFTLPDFAEYGDWKIPYTYDAANMMFNFTNAQDVGMYKNTYYVADIMFGSGYYSTFKSVSWDAYIDYNAEDGYFDAAMVDNGSWSYPFEAFYLRAFSSTTYSSTTDKGAIAIFYSPVIRRYDKND